jgi:hypothetical protein
MKKQVLSIFLCLTVLFSQTPVAIAATTEDQLESILSQLQAIVSAFSGLINVTSVIQPAALTSGDVVCEAVGDAQCYYVATTGDDANDGSFELPFATIQAAALIAQAGDYVYIRGGTYFDNDTNDADCNKPVTGVCLPNSGTAGSPITFTGYPGETVVLDQQSTGPGFLIYGDDNIAIKNELPRCRADGVSALDYVVNKEVCVGAECSWT